MRVPEQVKCDTCGRIEALVMTQFGMRGTLPAGWDAVWPLGDFCPEHKARAKEILERAKEEVRRDA